MTIRRMCGTTARGLVDGPDLRPGQRADGAGGARNDRKDGLRRRVQAEEGFYARQVKRCPRAPDRVLVEGLAVKDVDELFRRCHELADEVTVPAMRRDDRQLQIAMRSVRGDADEIDVL